MAGYSVLAKVDSLAAPAPAGTVAPPLPPSDTRKLEAEPNMRLVDLRTDVFIAGGGVAGVCAALAAARHGARVVLVQDRSRLGGNSSSEVKMHIVGADESGDRPGWREGGIIEELRLDDCVNNPQRSWEAWDLLLYDKIVSEPNITLLLDTAVCAATVRDGLITQVLARSDRTETVYRVTAHTYLDCTGDSRLGLEAGAEMRGGREAKSEFDESLAAEVANQDTLGSSILFTAREYGRPMLYTPPRWARAITENQLRFRHITSWEYGYWWIEWGGQLDPIHDNERIRRELLAIVCGIWDYIKNSGQFPTSANWAMDWVGFLPGKRGSRRLAGEYVLSQKDLEGKNGEPSDAVCIGGWSMDDHPSKGFDAPEERPTIQVRMPEVYSIPFRCLYSRNVRNLLMAGRNISATHVAFTSARVQATCGVIGQAVGTAAALCARRTCLPSGISRTPVLLHELQQTLLRDDQTLKRMVSSGEGDLARTARITASASMEGGGPQNVVNGRVRDLAGEPSNLWAAPVGEAGAWLELAWDRPQTIRRIQLTFDTGFQRVLTLSSKARLMPRMHWGDPQPETVRDYQLIAYDATGAEKLLADVTYNYQRLNRHTVEANDVRRLRLLVKVTNGVPEARLFEIRVYG